MSRSACKQRRERPALDVFENDEAADDLVAIDLVNGDDAGVLDPGGEPGLVQEAVEVRGAVEPVGSRHLDRDQPVQLLVPAEVDPAEVALAQQPDHDERADPLGPDGRGEDRFDEIAVVGKPTAVFLERGPLSVRERENAAPRPGASPGVRTAAARRRREHRSSIRGPRAVLEVGLESPADIERPSACERAGWLRPARRFLGTVRLGCRPGAWPSSGETPIRSAVGSSQEETASSLATDRRLRGTGGSGRRLRSAGSITERHQLLRGRSKRLLNFTLDRVCHRRAACSALPCRRQWSRKNALHAIATP